MIAIEILINEPNLVKCEKSTIIFGSLHGQFFDLYHLLETINTPDDINYVFLGDYGSMGCYGI